MQGHHLCSEYDAQVLQRTAQALFDLLKLDAVAGLVPDRVQVDVVRGGAYTDATPPLVLVQLQQLHGLVALLLRTGRGSESNKAGKRGLVYVG